MHKNTIETNRGNDNWYVGKVDEYEYQGQLVYAFEPDNRIADGSTEIYTSDCESLCHVGGFGGPAIILCNGDKFYEKAIFRKNVWTK